MQKSIFSLERLTSLSAAFALILCLNLAFPTEILAAKEQSLSWLKAKCTDGEGAIIWGNGGTKTADLKLFEISHNSTKTIGQGSQPEFSPDGAKIAWIKGSTAVGRLRKGDGTILTIASDISGNGGVHWRDNDHVLVVKDNAWRKVHIGTGEMTKIDALTKLGLGGSEVDVKQRDDGVWVWTENTTWKSSDGKSGSINGHCSPSLSPDGRWVTGLQDGHDRCALSKIDGGNTKNWLERTLDDCGSKGFDNQRWASHDQRFILAQYECDSKFGIWEVSTSDVFIVGATDGSQEAYGDFADGPGNTNPWPTGSTSPKAIIENASVVFAVAGNNYDPDSKELRLYTESGTMEDIAVGATPSWLVVSPRATSGKDIILDITVYIEGKDISGLKTDVKVTTSNAGDVAFTVSVEEVVDPIIIFSPNAQDRFEPGDTLVVKFDADESVLSAGVEILLSVDAGLTFHQLTTQNTIRPDDADWENFTWIIPDEIEGKSTVSGECLIRIEDYNEGTGVMKVSEMFGIGTDPIFSIRGAAGSRQAFVIAFNLSTSDIAITNPHRRPWAMTVLSLAGKKLMHTTVSPMSTSIHRLTTARGIRFVRLSDGIETRFYMLRSAH